jgi:hypothetical protein
LGDKVKGFGDNAAAALPLVANKPGESTNPRLQTGPATFSADGKKVLVAYSLPKEWDDLYQVWNMAFCSQIGSYPMWISKLFIPQLSSYKNRPQEYIHRRIISLYAALHYFDFSQIEDAKDGIPSIDWHDDALTRLWGKLNRESARDYKQLVEKARSGNP